MALFSENILLLENIESLSFSSKNSKKLDCGFEDEGLLKFKANLPNLMNLKQLDLSSIYLLLLDNNFSVECINAFLEEKDGSFFNNFSSLDLSSRRINKCRIKNR